MSRRILLTTDVVGGVWDFCLTLAVGLRTTGDDVVLLALGSPSLAQRHAASECGAHLISAPLRLEWMSDANDDVAITPRLVQQVAQQVGADVIHANQFAAACADASVPVVLTIHSDVLSWRRWTLGGSDVPPEWHAYRSLVRAGLTRADSVVAVSSFLAREIRTLYEVDIRRPIDVIHNGWPQPESVAPAREPITLVAGRIWDAAKNVRLVAHAASGWDPGEVLLAGERTHPDGGDADVPAPLKPLGQLSRDELDALLARAAVYISPARYDPFGLLPLQAALHGCQLLLSDIPSYRELWDGAACFFTSEDVTDLREKWQRLANDPARRETTLARARSFSAERMVRSYQQIYSGATRAAAA